MAKIEHLIPFILYFECALPAHGLELPLDKMFALAKKKGYVYDKDDTGGATMCGITFATFRSYCVKKKLHEPTITDLKNLTYQQWLDVLKLCFWDKAQGDKISSQKVADMIIDWNWHSGITALKIVQRLVGVTDDGIIGAKSLAAINAASPTALCDRIRSARLNFVEDIVRRKPSQRKFLRGWQRRINALYNGTII